MKFPEDYVEFVKTKAKINDKNISFYVKWVSLCRQLYSCGNSGIITREMKNKFLSVMASKYESWQVDQADEALRLYSFWLHSFSETKFSKREDDISKWENLLIETRKALRLRRRSFNTEKSYLYWIKAFSEHLNNKNIKSLNADDIQTFLSHIAVYRKVAPSTQAVSFKFINLLI